MIDKDKAKYDMIIYDPFIMESESPMKDIGLCVTSAWLKTWRGWICPISPVASGPGLKGKIQSETHV